MQIAICDDEKEIQKMLAERAKKLCPKAEVICYSSGVELLAAENAPDILFLDIQMQHKDGMETAKELRKRKEKTILIFVTVLEEYVFSAFDVGAFHYLVKPFSKEKFDRALCGAIKQFQENMKMKAGTPVKDEKSLLIKSKGVHIKIKLDDIVYAEVYNRKIILHMHGEEIEYYGRLSELERQAGEDFFRPHRAYLVHLKYVVKYNASTIWMEKGTALLAKQNYREFVKAYLRYNQRTERG